ncbi:hypothetical protein GWL_32030 [Herbaspirillum sp. GW103]|nr:hypothetical protein GWL_32030 [Herbaspirillum sp. GW103]
MPAIPPTIVNTHLMGLSSFEFLQEDFRSERAQPPVTPSRKIFPQGNYLNERGL